MSLRDEVVKMIQEQLDADPVVLAGKVYGSEAGARAGVSERDVLRTLVGALKVHSEVMIRLAEEIDKLSAAKSDGEEESDPI